MIMLKCVVESLGSHSQDFRFTRAQKMHAKCGAHCFKEVQHKVLFFILLLKYSSLSEYFLHDLVRALVSGH